MGVCYSIENTETHREKGGGGDGAKGKAKVIHADGRMEEFKQPIRAINITSENPGFFLCNSELMFIGSCVPELAEKDVLEAGQIYFLMPNSRAHYPLSLADVCALAIKASSALTKQS